MRRRCWCWLNWPTHSARTALLQPLHTHTTQLTLQWVHHPPNPLQPQRCSQCSNHSNRSSQSLLRELCRTPHLLLLALTLLLLLLLVLLLFASVLP